MNIIKKIQTITSFETERLLAIKLTEHDLDKFTLMHTNQKVMATLGGVRTPELTIENLNWNLQQWQENNFGIWMFYLKNTHEWIGRGGLRRITLVDSEEVELCYALMPEFWHQGFATEIARAAVEIAFEVLRLNEVVCFTLPMNKPSQRVMEHAGFQYEKDFVLTYHGIDYPHVLYRIKNYYKAFLVPYDQHWPEIFKQEANAIQAVLGNSLQEIHHVGSTAIPNMAAKPTIDIMIECDHLDDIELIQNKLYQLGYLYLNRQIIPHRSFFTRRQKDHVRYHLHVYEKGDPQIKRHVNFRDYLIHHPNDAQTYETLKLKLAEKFKGNINHYVFGKSQLIQEIDAKAKVWPGRRRDFLSPSTGKPLAEWRHESLTKAIIANFNIFMTHFAQYLNQIELLRVPGDTCVCSGLPDQTFNYVLDAHFTIAEANKKITEIMAYFAQKNVPFSWWITVHDTPEDLTTLLTEKNFRSSVKHVVLAIDLDAIRPINDSASSLTIIQALHKEELLAFILPSINTNPAVITYFSWIATVLTEDDPIEYHVGYVDNKPVVRSITCYFAGIAGIYWLAAAPGAEEHIKTMQQFQTTRAKTLGYHVATVLTTDENVALYKAWGYQESTMLQELSIASQSSGWHTP